MKYKACEKCAQSVGWVNIAGNVMMIALKAYLGFVGGSKGLIADAVHSVADLLATFVMMIGLGISAKKPNANYPDGFGKSEYMIAIAIYLFLFVIGIYIMHDGYVAIVNHHWIHPCWFALWGAVFAIAINELMFRQSVCAGTQLGSPSMVAKAWESRSDVYASIAVLVGIIGAMMGFTFMDPLAAFVVGVMILKLCIESIYESVLKLMDEAPPAELIEAAEAALADVPGILAVEQILGRELGPTLELRLFLTVAADLDVAAGEKIKAEARAAVAAALSMKTRVSVFLNPAEG